MKSRIPIFLVSLFILASCGCAPKNVELTTDQKIFSVTDVAIEVGSDVYERVLILTGEAYGNGLIDDQQLASVKAAGVKLDNSLTLAQETLSDYFRERTGSTTQVRAAMLALSDNMESFVRTAQEFGIPIPEEVVSLSRVTISIYDIFVPEGEIDGN